MPVYDKYSLARRIAEETIREFGSGADLRDAINIAVHDSEAAAVDAAGDWEFRDFVVAHMEDLA